MILPDTLRRGLFRNSVAWYLRNWWNAQPRIVDMEPPLAGYRMRLPRHYIRQNGVTAFEGEVCRTIEGIVQPGQVVWDVGSYLGYFSLLFSRRIGPSGRVIAFEPLMENRSLLLENIRLNGIKNIQVEPIALGAESGWATFQKSRSRFQGHGSLIHSDDRSRYVRIRVKMSAVDEIASKGEIGIPSFVKIDVEGAEGLVVRGGEHTLRNCSPTVLMEVHVGPSFPSTTAHEALGRLANLNYRLYCLEDDPELCQPLYPSDWQGHKHCLALPKKD